MASSWPPQTFRSMFLDDFIRFLEDPDYTPLHANTDNTLPSSEELHFFTHEVPRYISSYVDHYRPTNIRHKPPHPNLPSENYTMERFISQKDDPFTGIRDDQVPTPTDGDTSELRDAQNSIQQVQRRVQKWQAEEFTGVSHTETTREHSRDNGFKTLASYTAAAYSVESGVGGLYQAGPSSLKGASQTGSYNGIGNTHGKEGGRSKLRGERGKRSRPDEPFVSNQGLSAETGTGRRASASSRVSSTSRREPKPHICLQCNERFPFDARLRSHMAVHRKPEEKLLCPDCGSGFGRDSSLKRHQNTPGSCQKKKQAKLLDASHKGQISGSHNNFDGDSITSYHKSDISVDASLQHDPQYHTRIQPEGSGVMPRSHNTNPRPLHSLNQTHRPYDGAQGPMYYSPQGSGQNHLARHGTSPQVHAAGWTGIDPILWPADTSLEFGDYYGFENEGD